MPRAPRINIAGITLHVVQRGNNKQRTFFDDDDFRVYLHLLRKMSERYDVSVHAYVLMTNHVHLLMTQSKIDGISRTMQQLASAHSRRINDRLDRTGTLWESRFKSSPIDTDHYCLACYRYIELNPVRAGLVSSPADYCWSSYLENVGLTSNASLKPHQSFLKLGPSGKTRIDRYKALIAQRLDDQAKRAIRLGTAKGLPFGSPIFVRHLETETGNDLHLRKRGRPKKGV